MMRQATAVVRQISSAVVSAATLVPQQPVCCRHPCWRVAVVAATPARPTRRAAAAAPSNPAAAPVRHRRSSSSSGTWLQQRQQHPRCETQYHHQGATQRCAAASFTAAAAAQKAAAGQAKQLKPLPPEKAYPDDASPPGMEQLDREVKQQKETQRVAASTSLKYAAGGGTHRGAIPATVPTSEETTPPPPPPTPRSYAAQRRDVQQRAKEQRRAYMESVQSQLAETEETLDRDWLAIVEQKRERMQQRSERSAVRRGEHEERMRQQKAVSALQRADRALTRTSREALQKAARAEQLVLLREERQASWISSADDISTALFDDVDYAVGLAPPRVVRSDHHIFDFENVDWDVNHEEQRGD